MIAGSCGSGGRGFISAIVDLYPIFRRYKYTSHNKLCPSTSIVRGAFFREGGQKSMVEPNVLITPEMQEQLQIEAECFKSLVRFREVHLAGEKDVPSAEFHYRWSDILLNGRDHYAIEGFRESGKDQVVFQSNLMHAMTYPRRASRRRVS